MQKELVDLKERYDELIDELNLTKDSLEIEKEQGKLNFGDENPSQSYSQHSSTHAEPT